MENNNSLKVSCLIPTYNAGNRWELLLKSVNNQTILIEKKIIIDSGSSDETVSLAKSNGFEVNTIRKQDFDHSNTRQKLAHSASNTDILLFMTQDCILADKNSIENLLVAFNDENVAIAYGRQLPRKEAKILEAHSRIFNYPALSKTKTLADKDKMGIKTASCSNSFAAYRTKAFMDIGGFPNNNIFGEDVVVGGKLLLKGWKIAYVAEARCYHSHDYTVLEEFRRFFDIGVFHKTNSWLLQEFGKADGEGLRYLKSEFKTILKENILLLPIMLLSTIGKYIGYKLGLHYMQLPDYLVKKFSMHKSYWDNKIGKELNKFIRKT